jgi:hypothetical protein
MVFRVSAAAAQIQTSLSVVTPNPSATTWSRLDPLCTADDVALGLQAPIADPLWMLARQWQFNEFRGEDAGSPVAATLKLLGVPMRRLVHPQDAVPERALGPGAPPVEAMVEAEPVLAVHPKLNAQAGQHLMRMLRAAGQGAAAAALLANFPAAIDNPADPVADNAGFVWHRLLDARAIDALALAADFRAADASDAAADAFVAAQGIAAAAPVREVLRRWLVWLAELVIESDTPGASAYWNPQRLEYGFSLASQGVQPEVRLQADEYCDGRLDWHTFEVSAAGTAGMPVSGAEAVEWQPGREPMPTIARYPGMPADRYWEFEDGKVNFGKLSAAKSDLARLAVMEYALVFGNDWFTLPVTLAVNALYKVDTLRIRDNFGIEVPIPPARNADGTQWTMYEMSMRAGAPRQRLDDTLFLCPALNSTEGPALEQVLMMRDEMANMVWGVEKCVQGTSGEALDRRFESTRLSTTQTLRAPDGALAVAVGAPLSFKLQTPVAANWIPFLPVKREGANALNWSIQLQRGVVTQFYQVGEPTLSLPNNADYKAFIERLRGLPFVEAHPEDGPAANRVQGFMFHPRGQILRLQPGTPGAIFSTDFLRLEEEEVPRDGIEIKRAFNYARDADGRALLWIGRSKKTGRGEGASGLRFDIVKR